MDNITVKGNGIYHLTVELELHMIGRANCVLLTRSQVLIFKEVLFKYKCYLQTQKINVISLLGCIKLSNWKLLTDILEYL